MIEMWIGMALLALLCVSFLLWPAARGAGRNASSKEGHRAALATVYREQLADLQRARKGGQVDDGQFAQMETEIARNLLAAEADVGAHATARGGRGLLLVLAVLVPMLALGLYQYSGNAAGLVLYQDIVASQQGESSKVLEARISAGLEAWTERNPDDLTSRYALAQRQMVDGDLRAAVASYQYVIEREPQATGLKAELAQALFFANGSRISPEISGLVQQVLAEQPNNGTALGLAGIAAFESQDYTAARDYWLRALRQLPGDSPSAQALAAGVARAEKALADASMEGAAAAAVAVDGAQPAEPSIRVSVSLAEGIDAPADTPVFIYARGTQSRMPLAIVRLTASQLPAEVVLDKSSAMMPSATLATVDAVQVVARLALKGDARPAPGDWQGVVAELPSAQWVQPVSITIDEEL